MKMKLQRTSSSLGGVKWRSCRNLLQLILRFEWVVLVIDSSEKRKTSSFKYCRKHLEQHSPVAVSLPHCQCTQVLQLSLNPAQACEKAPGTPTCWRERSKWISLLKFQDMPHYQVLKYELSLVLVMYIFKAGGMKMQTEIGLMDSKDNKEHTGSLELPSSSC